MILGKVLPSGEAMVRLKVRGATGILANVEAMVETGFNDELALPPWVVERLSLKFVSASKYMLADGLHYAARVFEAEIEWLGSWREILVVEVEHDPLLGMAALSGHHLGIDVVAGGQVAISPLRSERPW